MDGLAIVFGFLFDFLSIEWDFGTFKFTMWQFWFVCAGIGVIIRQMKKVTNSDGGNK